MINIEEIEVIDPITIQISQSKKMKSRYKIFNDDLVSLIVKAVENNTCVTFEEMKTKGNQRRTAYPRFIAQYIIQKYTKHSLQSMAYLFGRTNHATTLNGIRRIESFKDFDKNIKNIIKGVEDDLSIYLTKTKNTKYRVFQELLWKIIDDEELKKEWLNKYFHAV